MAEEDFVPDEVPTTPAAPLKIKVPKAKAPAPPPVDEAPATPKEKPMTIGGYTENTLDKTWEFAKGLYNMFPAAIKSYQQNIPYIWKNRDALTPGMLFNFDPSGGDKDQIIKGEFKGAIPEALKGMLEGTKEKYKNGLGRAIYEDTPGVISDALAIFSVGVSQVKNIGRIAEAAGAGEKATRLIRAAEYLEQLPSKMARGAVDKSVKAVTGHDLAKERQFLNLKQEERGAEMLKLQDVAKDNLPAIDALNPAEKELFHKARVFGDTPYGVSEEILAQNPKVKAALEAYAPLEKYSKDVMGYHGYVSPEVAEQTLAKKYALEAFGNVSEESMAKAAHIINEAKASGKRLPMYGPNVFEGKGAKAFTMDEVLSDMMTGGKNVRVGKVNSLEEMKGAQGYTKDPSVYTRQMVKTTADVQAKARMMDRLLQEKELISGKAGAEGFKAGESIPEGIHRKYYEDPVRAQALQTITDPTIKRLLKWEYTDKQNAMLRLYDKFNSVFTKMATRYNPKWVPGNIVGDAFLGALFGADWDAAKAAIKARTLPSQFLSGKSPAFAADALERKSIISGMLDKYGDIAGQIDQATRAGILHKHVADKLKRFAADHEAFARSIEEVLTSTERFSDVQVGLQRIEENVARRSMTVRQRDKEIVTLKQREEALAAKLEGRELQKTVTNQEKLGTLQGRAEGKVKAAEKLAAPAGPHDWMNQIGPNATDAEIAAAKESAATASAKAEAQRMKSVLGRTGEAGFEKGMRVLDTIRQKIVNKTAERNAIVRDIMDDQIKSGALEKLVPGLRQQVEIVREGVERANAVLPSYLNLNGFEQRVMNRIIPFYPFTKTMNMLAFRIPFLAPIKSFAWNRLQDFLSTQTEDPRVKEYTKGRIPVYVLSDGRSIWWKMTQFSPFEGLTTSRAAGVPVPGMFDPLRNPGITLGYKFLGGKTKFDFGGIPYGEQAVSVGDGAVDRLMPNGLLKREIEPTPLVSGVMHTFPATQLAEAVLTPSRMNKYDWVGFPHPIMNPDGTYKAPREWFERVGAMLGINLQAKSKQDIIRSDQMESKKAFMALKKMWPTADAEEREMIKNAFEDRARGMYRQKDR